MKGVSTKHLVFAAALIVAGCASDGGSGGSSNGGNGSNGSKGGGACPAVAFGALTQGCTMTLRTPANCATVTIGAEFAWGADGCHTPYYLQIAGDPPTEANYNDNRVNTSPINALAWAVALNATHLEGLSSASGWYHWRVCNAYETGCSASRAFRLK